MCYVCYSGYNHNTLHSAVSVNIASDHAKNYFESLIPQILLTSERGRRCNIL